MPDDARRIVRVTAYAQIGFDLSVPRDADEATIHRLIALHTREMAGWFASLHTWTVLGDGNMTLEYHGLYDWEYAGG